MSFKSIMKFEKLVHSVGSSPENRGNSSFVVLEDTTSRPPLWPPWFGLPWVGAPGLEGVHQRDGLEFLPNVVACPPCRASFGVTHLALHRA